MRGFKLKATIHRNRYPRSEERNLFEQEMELMTGVIGQNAHLNRVSIRRIRCMVDTFNGWMTSFSVHEFCKEFSYSRSSNTERRLGKWL